MQPLYIARRFGVFLLIVWLAATLNFFLPRLSGQDPVRAKLLQQASLGGYVQGGIEEMTHEYERRFGLDQPLWRQYLTYLRDVSRLDFNYSIANYPRTVNEIASSLRFSQSLAFVVIASEAKQSRAMPAHAHCRLHRTIAKVRCQCAPLT